MEQVIGHVAVVLGMMFIFWLLAFLARRGGK
jgi:hypothetical protein